MKTVIYKYPLRAVFGEPQEIRMPRFPRLLHFGQQNEDLFFWAEVAVESKDTEVITFTLRGTGHESEDGGIYLGTTQVGPLVFHLFYE